MTIASKLVLRRRFGKGLDFHQGPQLLSIQRDSYEEFLQANVKPSERRDVGLQRVFKSIFPVKDATGRASLEFVSYELEPSRYDVEECKARGMSYVASLKVVLNLIIWDIDPETGKKTLSALKEDKVYFGEIPLMTEAGTFIINGTERVLVSQLQRSPGVFFSHDGGKTHSSGKLLFSARLIPYRGSWLDFEFDYKDILYARIDKKRKFPATILLRALGMDSESILNRFYPTFQLRFSKNGSFFRNFNPRQLEGQKAYVDIKVGDKILMKKGQKFTRAVIRKLAEAGIKEIELNSNYVATLLSAKYYFLVNEDLVHPKTKEKLLEKGQVIVGLDKLREFLKPALTRGIFDDDFAKELDNSIHILLRSGEILTVDEYDSKGKIVQKGVISDLMEAGINQIEVLYSDDFYLGDALWKTLMADKLEPNSVSELLSSKSNDEACVEIYKKIRPGDPARLETAKNTLKNLFFSNDRYDLSEVGIYKINHKLYISRNLPPPTRTDGCLLVEDILATVEYLLHLRAVTDISTYTVDDIDHLGNRRVRTVGELVENQFRIALARLERVIREKMSTSDLEVMVPQELVNFKPLSKILKDFFASGQLSQFLDQTNPLSELTHKRRLSALGPGGLTRERAGFEVRDVHATHFGRICPIETPEGQNIGLIVSLTIFATVNHLGFIQTPFRVVENGKVTDKVVYLTALEETRETVASASSWDPVKVRFVSQYVQARVGGEYRLVPVSEVTKLEVSSRQILSVSASLIPFLEHDDANRALMGSNMQRQAVPCIKPSAPKVGTGVEQMVAKHAGACIVAKRSGRVIYVDAERITIKADKVLPDSDDTGLDIYHLLKFNRTNQNTAKSFSPIVREGDTVKAQDVIADSYSTDLGELALGQNILVAFMPWHGFNFEDSSLVSERLLKDDIFTSIQIEEFECLARDSKVGREEITRDIPNIGEEALLNLDETGIVRVGAFVKPGDILVGKVTPKGEGQLTPEEKLLRAIFGEKAGEFKDSSLRVPPGISGIVIDSQIYTRRGVQKDERAKLIEQREIAELEKDLKEEIESIKEGTYKQLVQLLQNKKVVSSFSKGKISVSKGTVLTEDLIRSLSFENIKELNLGDDSLHKKVFDFIEGAQKLIANRRSVYNDKIKRVKEGDDLPAGIVKMVKVYVASKRKIQPGDKFAGRHGNKGVVSKIVPEEDMPFLEDGTPVHMVLNPLGVPSRMNIGQILECYLGLLSFRVGQMISKTLEKVMDMSTGIEKKVPSSVREEAANRLKEIFKVIYSDDDYEKLDKLSITELFKFAYREASGPKFATPSFDPAREEEIDKLFSKFKLPTTGKCTLIDGRTGQKFQEPVSVGYMYMLKLHHMVEDKIHARSIGPYSLVTQQPLGGKSQMGGQRLGEMEVWALEAYGAAFTLQEFLTVKSDDVSGRTRMYESIVKGVNVLEPGTPESFNVTVKELQALALNVEFLGDDEDNLGLREV